MSKTMSRKSSSRNSTPPTSSRSKTSVATRSPTNSNRDVRTSTPDTAGKLNFTLYGAPAPITKLRPSVKKNQKHFVVTTTPPTTPVDTYVTVEKCVLSTSSSARKGVTTPHAVQEQVGEKCRQHEHVVVPMSYPKSPEVQMSVRRSVSPLDLSSLNLNDDDDDDDDDVVESHSRTPFTESVNEVTGSITIDELSGSTSKSSSFVTISGSSTQSCTSLPLDDNTLKSHKTDALFPNDDNSKRPQMLPELRENDDICVNSYSESVSSPGHRMYILERLESGYYSPDTSDVRFSVSEVLEAAEYAHRLATLLDQALSRDVSVQNPDGEPHQRSVSLSPNVLRNLDHRSTKKAVEVYEEERKKFLANVGGHPAFQSVYNKIELFESGDRGCRQENVENGRVMRFFRDGVAVKTREACVPIPPPLPYEGFQTVHDGRCYCCGPRLMYLSPDDLQRQRERLKKVPTKEKQVEEEEDTTKMNLQEILKSVITRRRDVVMPVEEGTNSGRSDWSLDESCSRAK